MKLTELHALLGKEFIDRIKSKKATPSDLNAARQFLKDNGITGELEAGDDLDVLGELIDDTQPLPFVKKVS